MRRLPFQLFTSVVLAAFVICVLPARSQAAIHSSDFYVTTSDGISIHVHEKVEASVIRRGEDGPGTIPVLLIHGWGGNGQTWDFPGRSVMDHLAAEGYDVYALDLRGVGLSVYSGSYFKIDLLSRLNDAVAAANYIKQTTGRRPVVLGWSQGGVITGLLAASAPKLVAGVGFLSVAEDGFSIPANLASQLPAIIASGIDRLVLPPLALFELYFGIDPVTGQPTISSDAFNTFALPPFSQEDSLNAVLEAASPVFFNAYVVPAWRKIRVPALVADGYLDPLAGEPASQQLFNALQSENKQMVVFPRNSHGWFLEDNHDVTIGVVDRFLSQFGSWVCSRDRDCERPND
jgi:pimeloyl-ACP methyl ester carboxylesterase